MQMPSVSFETPSVSVVIAAFNAEESLVRAVESALAQTVPVEVIIVDDASSDRTLELAFALMRAHPQVRILTSGANEGPSAARNKGIVAARGEWIAILDADDAFAPERLRQLTALGERHDADMVADNLHFYDWNAGRVVGTALSRQGDVVRHIHPVDFVRNAITGQSRFDFGQLKPMFRRRFMTARCLRYPPDLRHGEDFALMFDCLLADARFILTTEAHYLFTQRQGSISAQASGQSRTHLNLHAMREHSLALLDRPRVRGDQRLTALLNRRARAIGQQLSWNRVYPHLRARRPVALMGAMMREWSNWPMLARHILRRWQNREMMIRGVQVDRSNLSNAPLS